MDETFATYHRFLSIIGVAFFSKENWSSRPWFLFQIFNFIIGILTFTFTTGFVVNSRSDLLIFIQGACIWTTGVIMTLSLVVCLFFRNDFRYFLNEMIFKDTMLEMPLIGFVLRSDNGEKLMELKSLVVESQVKLLTYSRLLLKSYVAVAVVCATLYLCSPIYVMIQSNDSSLRLLAFDMWFPWSLENFNLYIASFVFHAYCAWVACITLPGLQASIILLVGQLIRHLHILGFILLHLDELATEITANYPERWQQCCSAILMQCVKHYVSIKKFSNKLNVICRPFYLTLILVTIMLVCMCSVKIAISNKLAIGTLKYYIHGLCFILVVLMFCSLGQQVENECTHLEMAVTEKWYIFDKTHKKNVLIFKMALSQRIPIYIFGTIKLSLPTFTWFRRSCENRGWWPPSATPRASQTFIKTGMSFFTLVMSVLEEAQ